MKYWSVYLLVSVGLLLFFAEGYFVYDESAALLAAISLVPAACFALLTWAELTVIGRKRAEKAGTLVGAYMLFKGLRLLLTVVAVAGYIYVSAPLRMTFVTNVLTLFLVALITTSICHLRAERKTE